MNPEAENSESEGVSSIAVEPAPAKEHTLTEDTGPVGALVAFALLVAGVGKKLEMVLQAGHEERMKAIDVATKIAAKVNADAVETETVLRQELEAVGELKTALEKDLVAAKEVSPCACEDNRVALEELARRLKRLESWKKRGVRTAKPS